MRYKVVVNGFSSGLNELLHHQEKRWDRRLKRYRVYNTEKAKNDKLCKQALIKCGLKNLRIENPISINYTIYVKDKKHDRDNTEAAIKKSFQDALQQLKIIKNDGFDYILDSIKPTRSFIDRSNPRVEIEIIEVETEREKKVFQKDKR